MADLPTSRSAESTDMRAVPGSAAEVERREALYRRLLEQASDVAMVVDERAQFLYLSPGIEALAGYHGDELIGTNGLRFVHADDLERATELLESAKAEPGVPQRARVRGQHRDGSWLHLTVTVTSFCHDPDIGGVVVNLHDVTDTVAAQRALEASERTFSSLVEHSSDIVVVLRDGLVQYVSSAVTRLLGHPVDEVVGRPGLDFVDPDHHERVGAILARESGDEPDTVELRLTHTDGSRLWFEARGTDMADDPVIEGVLINLRLVDERHRYEEQLERQALHDDLTGLPNRALLENRVAHALARASDEAGTCALLFVDLDRFKLVNETAGHGTGDVLLREVARRLTDAVDPADTVARFGGDEFAVLCEDLRDLDDAVAASARMHEQFTSPIVVDEREIRVSASIGIAMADHEADGDAGTRLIQEADTAMHVAKERGRGRTEIYEEALRSRVTGQMELLADLHRALDGDELWVAYQPIVSLADRSVVGAEALVRWDHPVRGPVPPGAFIGLAEDADLIGRLGQHVIERAAARAAAWAEPAPSFFVSVNVSSRQLAEPGFAEEVLEVLGRAGADPRAVVLELTESSLLGTERASRVNLERFEEAGVPMAIDDFGTGYSSLANLQHLGAELLKIDGSFVHDVTSSRHGRAIVAAVIELGHALGLRVVAEHVETAEQADVLATLGCDLGQGYLFARPAPAGDLERLLGSRSSIRA